MFNLKTLMEVAEKLSEVAEDHGDYKRIRIKNDNGEEALYIDIRVKDIEYCSSSQILQAGSESYETLSELKKRMSQLEGLEHKVNDALRDIREERSNLESTIQDLRSEIHTLIEEKKNLVKEVADLSDTNIFGG